MGDRFEDWERERDEAYRAIGHYVVTFSQLVSEMRGMTCQHVAKGMTDMNKVSLLLGEAPAEGVATAFFGMCRAVGELDEDEERVWSTLRGQVREAIETRNDIAHGDWQVGNVSVDPGGDPLHLPPRLIRIRPVRGDGPFKVVDLSVTEIDGLTSGVELLLGLIQDFGKLALKLPVFKRQGEPLVAKGGEYRVRDVLVVTGGNRKSKAKVVWSGTHADKVWGGIYSELARSSQEDRRPDS